MSVRVSLRAHPTCNVSFLAKRKKSMARLFDFFQQLWYSTDFEWLSCAICKSDFSSRGASCIAKLFQSSVEALIIYLAPTLFADLRSPSHLSQILTIHKSISSAVNTMVEQCLTPSIVHNCSESHSCLNKYWTANWGGNFWCSGATLSHNLPIALDIRIVIEMTLEENW